MVELDEDAVYRRTLGRYALFGEFATGGMAAVHYGRALGGQDEGRVVALKRLLPAISADPAFVRMFLAEGHLAALIQHPKVVATHEVVSTNGEIFHVMEYIAGETLARLLRKTRDAGEPVPPRIVVGILRDVLSGLHAAHEARDERGNLLGLVHRDVSPQNVIVGTDGVARVLDFGVATAENMVDEVPDHIRGKVSYMAPEQLAHEAVDRRTDLYAASVVLWEALVGYRLFKADDISSLILKVMADPVRPPGEHRQGIPRALDMVVMKGIERNIDDRWSSCREMSMLLEQALPPAPAQDIGAWVKRVGGERLAHRGYVVAQIESQSLAHIPVPPLVPSLPPPSAIEDLAALEEPSLPSAVEQVLAGDPKVVAVIRRRSEPSIPIGLPGPFPRPSTPAEPTPPATGAGTLAIALAGVALLAGILYLSTVVGRGSTPAPAPSSSARDDDDAIVIRRPRIDARASDADAGDCATPFTVDSLGKKTPKRHCFGTRP